MFSFMHAMFNFMHDIGSMHAMLSVMREPIIELYAWGAKVHAWHIACHA